MESKTRAAAEESGHLPRPRQWRFAIKLKEGQSVNLSEQFLISTLQPRRLRMLNGGYPALDMAVNTGVVLEQDFPYTGTDTHRAERSRLQKREDLSACKEDGNLSTSSRVRSIAFRRFYKKCHSKIRSSVIASVYASEQFAAYKGGVYDIDETRSPSAI